jgi:hypothetical protein
MGASVGVPMSDPRVVLDSDVTSVFRLGQSGQGSSDLDGGGTSAGDFVVLQGAGGILLGRVEGERRERYFFLVKSQ